MHLLTTRKPLKHLLSSKQALLFLAILLLGFAAGCGKRRVPLPPVERVKQRAEISGSQRGNRIQLQWTMPARKAGDKSILSIQRVDIYRLAEKVGSPLSLTEEDFASRSTLIDSVPVKDENFGKQMTFTDMLEFAGQPVRLRYAVRFVNNSGQRAAFSNFLLIEPSERIALNPTNLKTLLTEEAITLTWTPPEKNINGTSPANIMGYNVF